MRVILFMNNYVMEFFQYRCLLLQKPSNDCFCVNFRQTWNELIGVPRRGLLIWRFSFQKLWDGYNLSDILLWNSIIIIIIIIIIITITDSTFTNVWPCFLLMQISKFSVVSFWFHLVSCPFAHHQFILI
jgi:hypothetical protein